MNPRLTWHDAFSVGHAALDAQHRGLIRCINRICAMLHANERTALLEQELEALTRMANEHFDHEIAVLREIVGGTRAVDSARSVGHAAIQEHAVVHGSALASLFAIRERIGLSAPNDLSQYCDELARWFIDHTVKYDAHVKSVFQAMS